MAILNKIGRIVSAGNYVAPHTWFSCVHVDDDEDRTLADLNEDVSSISTKVNNTIKSCNSSVQAGKITLTYQKTDGTSVSVDLKTIDQDTTKAGLMSPTSISLLNDMMARLKGTTTHFAPASMPFYFLGEYESSATLSYVEAIRAMNNDINALHYKSGQSDSFNGRKIPSNNIVWMSFNGSPLWVFNTVLSYGTDDWVQTAINAKLYQGMILPGEGLCKRRYSGGKWGDWVNLFEKIGSLESRIERIEETM